MATTAAGTEAHPAPVRAEDFPTTGEGVHPVPGEPLVVPSRNSAPAATTRRPAQPIRPVPATRLAADLLAVKARRRRFQQILPPRAGERGW